MNQDKNKENFLFFISEAKYWISDFGLFDWNIHFTTEEPPSNILNDDTDFGYLAWYQAVESNKAARIGLSLETEKDSQKSIAKAAFHEVCEILLHPLEGFARCDAAPSTTDAIITEKHTVIRRLEKTIFEPYWQKRTLHHGD